MGHENLFRIIESYIVKIVGFIKLLDPTRLTNKFPSFGGFIHKFSANADLYLGIFLISTGLIYLLVKNKGEEKLSKIDKIFIRLKLAAYVKTDIPVRDKKGEQKLDEHGRKMFVEDRFIPKLDLSSLPKSFIIRDVHPTKENAIISYLNGVLSELHKEGIIPFDSGNIQKTGNIQGEFSVNLHDRQKLEEMDMFRKIRWNKTEDVNGVTREYFPEVVVSEKEVTLQMPDALKTVNDETIQRGIEVFSKFIKIPLKPTFSRSKDQTQIFFSYQKPLTRHFNFGDMICNKLDVWKEHIILPMRKLYHDKMVEYTFFGELEDPSRTLNHTQIFSPLTGSPHYMVVGQTRSGKTKSILSQIVTHAYAFPYSEFVFADGKSSQDYDPMAKAFSRFPVAKLAKGDDPLIELANVVFYSLRKYEENQKKIDGMGARGFACSNYVDHNKIVKADTNLSEEEKERLYIRRFFLYIDEFAEFISMVNVEKLVGTKDTIFWAIAKLLRASASAGFTVIIASQRYQNTDFPTILRSNLTNWLIHMMNIKDAGGIDMADDVAKLKSGSFVLKSPGIYCEESKNPHLQCTMPFIGEGQEIQKTIEYVMAGDNDPITGKFLKRETYEQQDFDQDLIYNQGNDDSVEKMSPSFLMKNVKQLFLKREGFEIVHEGSPETDYISIVAMDNEGIYYSIGIIEAKEIEDADFYIRLSRNPTPKFNKSRKVFFVQGQVKNAIKLQEFLNDLLGKTYLIRDIDFVRPLRRALELYRNKDSSPLFLSMLDIERAEGSDPSSLYDRPERDDEINLEKLNEIRVVQNPQVKGDLFEDWYMNFERKLGHDTIKARSVIDDGIIENIFATSRADGGFDLLRWVDKEAKTAIGIQCKNQTSRALDDKVIDKCHKSKTLYTNMGIEIVDSLVVSTGKFTQQAKDVAREMHIKIIDGTMLEKMIEEFQEDLNPEQKIKKVKAEKSTNPKSSAGESTQIHNLGEVLDFDIDGIEEDEEYDDFMDESEILNSPEFSDDEIDDEFSMSSEIEKVISALDIDRLSKRLKGE